MEKERPLGMKCILMLIEKEKHEEMLQGKQKGVKKKKYRMKRMVEVGFKLCTL